MKQSSQIRRVPVRTMASRASVPVAVLSAGPLGRIRRKVRGQSMLLIALCMLLLVALVALAIDGGAMLGERREAQNSVDGAALAGTRYMLPRYLQMIQNNPDYDNDENTQGIEDQIREKIDNFAAANGVDTTTLTAYFINDDKQLVTVNVGEERGNTRCGVGSSAGPCQVGANGRVPWTLGAKGIMVKGTAKSDSFFMSIFGWEQVGAAATATAFMGVGAAIDDINVVPMGLFSDTFPDLSDLQPGDERVLIDSYEDYGGGNWGWVNFNGLTSGDANLFGGWLTCGFNPTWTKAQWEANCPRYDNAQGWGPTMHYENISETDIRPRGIIDRADYTPIRSLVYGDGYYGWWLLGSSGQVNNSCQLFERRIQDEDPGGGEGVVVLFPIFDETVEEGGSGGTFYHVRLIIAFKIRERGGYNDVQCHPVRVPTATQCPAYPSCNPTPTPNPNGDRIKMQIKGVVDRIYSTTSRGRHGNLRHSFTHSVFLDN